VIVPAVMLMLGENNWKLPALLERRLPHFRVEGSAARPTEALGVEPA
jgi:uncharacterized membrane protein YdfJ with MMPL/SSD domain